jgi:hypothetical protein
MAQDSHGKARRLTPNTDGPLGSIARPTWGKYTLINTTLKHAPTELSPSIFKALLFWPKHLYLGPEKTLWGKIQEEFYNVWPQRNGAPKSWGNVLEIQELSKWKNEARQLEEVPLLITDPMEVWKAFNRKAKIRTKSNDGRDYTHFDR